MVGLFCHGDRIAADTPPDAIFSKAGDMRRLKYRRLRHVFNEHKSACLTDLRFAPVWRPGGTTAYQTSRRYHEYLQNAGPLMAVEFVEYTLRYYFYPAADSLACQTGATIEERMPRWVIAVKDWP